MCITATAVVMLALPLAPLDLTVRLHEGHVGWAGWCLNNFVLPGKGLHHQVLLQVAMRLYANCVGERLVVHETLCGA